MVSPLFAEGRKNVSYQGWNHRGRMVGDGKPYSGFPGHVRRRTDFDLRVGTGTSSKTTGQVRNTLRYRGLQRTVTPRECGRGGRQFASPLSLSARRRRAGARFSGFVREADGAHGLGSQPPGRTSPRKGSALPDPVRVELL